MSSWVTQKADIPAILRPESAKITLAAGPSLKDVGYCIRRSCLDAGGGQEAFCKSAARLPSHDLALSASSKIASSSPATAANLMLVSTYS
jgi:hypothetical protein